MRLTAQAMRHNLLAQVNNEAAFSEDSGPWDEPVLQTSGAPL